jgi:hypothetical protein
MALRLLELAVRNGYAAYVAPQSWMFLKGYAEFRAFLMRKCSIRIVARLGERGFQSADANGEQVSLNLVCNSGSGAPQFYGLDAKDAPVPEEKAKVLYTQSLAVIDVQNQLARPQHVISFAEHNTLPQLASYATALRGCGTGDAPRFVRQYWEPERLKPDWEFHHTTASGLLAFDGMSEVIFWQQESGALAELAESVRHLNHAAQNWRRGKPNWGKAGVIVSQMGEFPAALYTGAIYDPNCCAIVPNDESHLAALWALSESPDFAAAVKAVNQNRKVEVRTFLSIGFDLGHWQQVATERYPNGLPKPYSDDPTQWIFHGHPKPATDPLQVAIARLLGYRWPAETDADMELSDEARTWIAESAKLAALADDDGIACIPPVRGEKPAAERLLDLLIAAWGPDWQKGTLDKLLAQADCAGKSLDYWLRERFFEQHSKRFQHRPFIWHVWDGLKDGFAALVNYHKLDRKNLEALIYTYLGDWIRTQDRGARDGIDGADLRLAAAQALKTKLEKILEGEAPYDIFVRWKPLDQQPIGWEPDLNDGVRLNIRPFMTAEVLRHNKKPKLNIAWDKDRGKDVESAPWFKVFKGDRINDHHLTLADKLAARSKI